MATKTNNAKTVRAFGDTRGVEADTAGMGGGALFSPTKVQGQPLHVLNWTFGDSKFGPRCFVQAVINDALDGEHEITVVLSDKSPAYHQLAYMDEQGDSGEFTGRLVPQGKSFEWE